MAFYGALNKRLRSRDATIPFELEMMGGGIHTQARMQLMVLRQTKHFDDMGIETEWAFDYV